MSSVIEKSYTAKLGFYIGVLALPTLLMMAVESLAGGSSISVSGGDPTRFLAFVVYFLPGLIWARKATESWWRTMGVGIAYIIISPAYYFAALRFACEVGARCVSV